MTHPTDEELDALVSCLIEVKGGKLSFTNMQNHVLLAVADALTALRAQLAEFEEMLDAAEKSNRISDNGNMWRFWADKAREIAVRLDAANARADRAEAERAFTVSDGQRMLRKQDILTVCDTPDLCFEHDDSVARCGPCAAKLAERTGIALNQYTVSNPEAMRMRRDLDRAEAERAAQIEAIGSARLLIDTGWSEGDGYRLTYHTSVTTKVLDILDDAMVHPHDSTALDRIIAATRAKALRDAADRTLGLATGHDCRQAILAMIDKEGA